MSFWKFYIPYKHPNVQKDYTKSFSLIQLFCPFLFILLYRFDRFSMNCEETIISTVSQPIPNTDRFKPSHRSTIWGCLIYLEMHQAMKDQSIQSSKQESSSTLSVSVPPSKCVHIANTMRNSIIIKDHVFNSQIYPSCFSAASAIDWLLMNGYVDSRSEGVQLCKELVSGNLLIPLTNLGDSFAVEL